MQRSILIRMLLYSYICTKVHCLPFFPKVTAIFNTKTSTTRIYGTRVNNGLTIARFKFTITLATTYKYRSFFHHVNYQTNRIDILLFHISIL